MQAFIILVQNVPTVSMLMKKVNIVRGGGGLISFATLIEWCLGFFENCRFDVRVPLVLSAIVAIVYKYQFARIAINSTLSMDKYVGSNIMWQYIEK